MADADPRRPRIPWSEEASLSGRLNLNSQRLPDLPAEIGQLSGLRELNLGDNRLTALPPEIGQLTNLRALFLSVNQLTALPPEIGKLASVQVMDLSVNRLVTLPPEMIRLAHLQRLYVGMNHLATLPLEVPRLTGLERLYLDRNQLTALPPEIGQLTNLRELNLSGNQLTALPPEIGQLTNLRELNLSDNQLTALPPEIGQLTNLRELNLSDNQLRALPRQLADLLGAGLELRLRNNPLTEPFPELIARGLDAVAIYLRSLGDAVPQYDAKVLLVGEGNVGKTSLIAALVGAPFVPGRPTTHGIEILPLTVRHPDLDAAMTVRAWDFGGQEVYRVTHQFFFSRRALYMVVWNAREGHEQNEVEGWLRRIRLRVSREARILVVATHCDERRPELDYPHLDKTVPGLLAGQYEVDNLSGRGITALREGIATEAARLPVMGQLISTRWIAARDEILALAENEPQIRYEQFVEVCEHHYVDGDEITTLAELMHDLGQVVYYGDDEGLRDIVVLNPEWLTKAISYVLEDEPTRQSGGVLDHARLAGIWVDRPGVPGYPTRYHPYFLRLMEKFDVSYRLEDDSQRSLVAQLVPHDRPSLPWDIQGPPPAGVRSMALVCQLSEPAPGLVAWLTVRHHRASTGKHWRGGVFLRHPIAEYASEALIELRAPEQLGVYVRAPSPDFFFNVLRDSVEELITRRWPGLTYQLLVPCPSRLPDGHNCRALFPLDGLLRYREGGGTRYFCLQCSSDHDVSQLLTGFAQPELPLRRELERLHQEIAAVGSSVNHLEGGIDRIASYSAETAGSMRRVLRAVSSEITDCPLLFSLAEQSSSGTRRLRFDRRHYQLTLWCEHPGYWHPWSPASYTVNQPKEWLIRVGPYANLILKALRLAMPLTTPVADMVLTDERLKNAQHQLDLMAAVIAELPGKVVAEISELAVEDQGRPAGGGSAGQLTPAEGDSARALRMLLFELDRPRAFGALRRVQAPSGDFLWVCADHYSEYDPGLPVILGSKS